MMENKITIGRDSIVQLVINEIKEQKGYTNEDEFKVNIEVFPDDLIMEITVKEANQK